MDNETNRFYNWYAYVEVLMLIGEYEDAVFVLNEGLKKHHRAELYFQLSNSYYHLKNDKLSLEMLEKAMELDPKILEDMQQKYPFIRDEAKKVKAKKK